MMKGDRHDVGKRHEILRYAQDVRDQLRARSTALMAGVARSAAVMSARCFTSLTSTSITMSKKSIERLTMRRLEMLPSWRAITVDRLDRLPGWFATVILRRPV